MARCWRWLGVASFTTLGACGSFEPTFDWFEGLATAHHRTEGQRVGTRRTDVGPAVGDHVTYDLELSTPTSVARWVMRLTATRVPGPDEDGPVVLYIDVVDESGEASSRTRAELPARHFRTGFFPAGVALVDGELADEEAPRVVDAVGAILSVLSVVRESPDLSEILWQVVQKPSVFSVIVNFGVHIEIKLSQSEVRPSDVQGPGWEVTSYRVPMAMAINDTAALHVSVHVVEPRRPLTLGAGIVSLIAERPDGSGVRFRMRLREAEGK